MQCNATFVPESWPMKRGRLQWGEDETVAIPFFVAQSVEEQPVMRYHPRTLLILLTVAPPLIADAWWKYDDRPGWHLRQSGWPSARAKKSGSYETRPTLHRQRR